MALSLPQLETIWVNAGGKRSLAPLMARIALRESGGNPAEENLKNPDHSIGLWQVNQLAWKGQFGSDRQLQNPAANARAAVQIMAKQGPKAWSTYNPAVDSKYIGTLGNGPIPAAGPSGSTIPTASPDLEKRAVLARYLQGADPDNLLLKLGVISPNAPAASKPYPTLAALASKPGAQPGARLHPGGFAGGFLPQGAHYAPGRKDQGRDGQTNPGGALVAPGDGTVLRVGSDPSGFGPAYPIVKFTSGQYAGKTIYLGHTIAALPAGHTFTAGQVLSRTGTHGIGNATTPGWFEVGYAPGGVPGHWGQETPF